MKTWKRNMSVGYTGIVVIPVVNCDVLKYLNNDKNCYILKIIDKTYD